jgi:hypothetical protein
MHRFNRFGAIMPPTASTFSTARACRNGRRLGIVYSAPSPSSTHTAHAPVHFFKCKIDTKHTYTLLFQSMCTVIECDRYGQSQCHSKNA